jgi:hypothetical protein
MVGLANEAQLALFDEHVVAAHEVTHSRIHEVCCESSWCY